MTGISSVSSPIETVGVSDGHQTHPTVFLGVGLDPSIFIFGSTAGLPHELWSVEAPVVGPRGRFTRSGLHRP